MMKGDHRPTKLLHALTCVHLCVSMHVFVCVVCGVCACVYILCVLLCMHVDDHYPLSSRAPV